MLAGPIVFPRNLHSTPDGAVASTLLQSGKQSLQLQASAGDPRLISLLTLSAKSDLPKHPECKSGSCGVSAVSMFGNNVVM